MLMYRFKLCGHKLAGNTTIHPMKLIIAVSCIQQMAVGYPLLTFACNPFVCRRHLVVTPSHTLTHNFHETVESITSHPESIFQTLKVIRISVNFEEMIWMYFQFPTLNTLTKNQYFLHGTIRSTFDLLQQSTTHVMQVLWEATVWSNLASVAILQFRPTFFFDNQFW